MLTSALLRNCNSWCLFENGRVEVVGDESRKGSSGLSGRIPSEVDVGSQKLEVDRGRWGSRASVGFLKRATNMVRRGWEEKCSISRVENVRVARRLNRLDCSFALVQEPRQPSYLRRQEYGYWRCLFHDGKQRSILPRILTSCYDLVCVMMASDMWLDYLSFLCFNLVVIRDSLFH